MFIQRLPKVTRPMIAAVDGLAVGVGVTMLLHCDLVYATPAASFRTPFVDLGLIQEAGSSLLGPARLGYARAFELFCWARPWGAARAAEAGLINAVVPAGELEAKALAAARRLAAKPRAALLAARRMLKGDPALQQDDRRGSGRLQGLDAHPRSQGSLHRLPGEAPAGFRQGAAWRLRIAADLRQNGGVS